ncbi:MAG: hypothetical protein Q9Q40_00575 [Acidobacteriota bacterium]|nr:hypothetical protein [Acidobacteriota bacterium]
MNAWIERLKPAASRRTQLVAAALMWSVVGVGLGAAGTVWAASAPWPWPPILVIGGLLLGAAKGLFVLAPAAGRVAGRIARRKDGSCLGGAFSWKSWSMVAVMMSAGMLLRRSPLPRPVLGLLYVALATALFVGGARLWRTVGAGWE